MDRLSDYDYSLPDELIAQEPLADRSASRLLWLHRDSGDVEHRRFADVVEILQPTDTLVLNDTRVTARRLFGRRPTGGQIEALLVRDLGNGRYEALLKPAKRLKPGSEIEFEGGTKAIVEQRGDPMQTIRFLQNLVIESLGEVPLPPYITHRLSDPERYQTVYAQAGGSAAAPTAGLHFTTAILDQLRAKGVRIAHVTLDVGIDTFRPVQSENLDEHTMHGEQCTISPAAADMINSAPGRIIAVGTTAVRTLESLATGPRRVRAGSTDTRLFIRPGYEFRIIDGMFTNFHLPRTTMLMMISALASRETIFRSYAEAVQERYRFLSFGDSMLLL